MSFILSLTTVEKTTEYSSKLLSGSHLSWLRMQWWMVLMKLWGWMNWRWETLSWDAHDLTLSSEWLNPASTVSIVSLRCGTGWKENRESLRKHVWLFQLRSIWPGLDTTHLQELGILLPGIMQSQAPGDSAFQWDSQVVVIAWCASSAAALDLIAVYTHCT